jgi:hypothetical protein
MVPAVKVILLELNELSPDLMSRFIDEGELPNFRRLRAQSTLYTTDADEDPPSLQPWIQWITVHTGVPSGVVAGGNRPGRVGCALCHNFDARGTVREHCLGNGSPSGLGAHE